MELQGFNATLSVPDVSVPKVSCGGTVAELKERDSPTDTPTHMLDVAERRFAESGLDNVSLREIVRLSGQSNLSAAHYHFGSREGLIGALLTRRLRTINLLRNERLDALAAATPGPSVNGVVQQSIGPLADVVKSTVWGADYVRVAAQVLLNPQAGVLARIEPDAKRGLVRCTRMLRQLLPQLAPEVFEDRIRILNNETVYSIARWVYANGRVTPENHARFERLVRHTTEFLAAGLMFQAGAAHTGQTLAMESTA